MTEPTWVRHAVWWQIYPLGFVGADRDRRESVAPSGPGAIRRLVPWLDYAVRLGASGIALGPVFESETHGYDTVDPFRIDGRLGGDGDFAELVEQAHARGLRILLDGVFNHVGRGFPAFQRALAGGSERSWFHFDGDQYARWAIAAP